MPKRRSRTLKGEMTDLAYELKEFENVSVKPTRSVLVIPPEDPEHTRKCGVIAGSEVSWAGKLTKTQCERFQPDPSKLLGRGSFAAAYAADNDPKTVVKFTTDRLDAAASALVMKKKPVGTVNIFDVVKLKGQEATTPVLKKKAEKVEFERKRLQPVFAIRAERLARLNRAEERAVISFWEAYKGKWSDPDSPRNIARRMDPKDFRINDLVDMPAVVDTCALGADREVCEQAVKDIEWSVDELASIGSIPLDLHMGNWGVREGRRRELVILDLGVSAGKQKPPRIRLLAGAVGKRKKR